jgi:CheY-like chemotaxis protein
MLSAKSILLVEDDCVDAMAVRRVLRDLHAPHELTHARDGREALDYLQGRPEKMPCLILLDLNMPRMNGLELLKVLRTDAGLTRVPVVIVTTSAEKEDVDRSFELGATAYVVKCPTYQEFREKMTVIKPYLQVEQAA